MDTSAPRSNRRTVFALAAVYVALAAVLFACKSPEAATADDTAADDTKLAFTVAIGNVTERRVCAAATVYTTATADDWSQRAAIARAALNHYDQLGHVPDCGSTVATIVAGGLDTYLWQAALDAVDAVESGSYALPLACARADTVLPSDDRYLLAESSPSARAQCVIGDLAFVRTQGAA